MCNLRVLEIYTDPSYSSTENFDIFPFLIRSLRTSLISPATLEHIIFNIVFEGCYRHNEIDYHSFFDDLRCAWSHLDPIIIHPSGSRLKRVDINIEFAFRSDDDYVEEVSEAVLDALPLLREKGILFVETLKY